MQEWIADIEFEKFSPLARASKTLLINPFANYAPSGMLRWLLKVTRSELAEANWADPGGWRSMVISYNGQPTQVADKLLVGAGTMSRALRNRRRLAAAVLARLIDASPRQPAHVLCLGAGPGHIISDALCKARPDATATLVDLSSDAFDYGRELARKLGLSDRIKFVLGDARNIKTMLAQPPDIVKLLGLCEYLTDEQIASIVRAAAEVMPPGATIVTNSLSMAHGTDRFFRRVFGLNMIYRDEQQMKDLLAPCGFGDFQVLPEPLGVYTVIVGRKA